MNRKNERGEGDRNRVKIENRIKMKINKDWWKLSEEKI